jgi:hypothetical protein
MKTLLPDGAHPALGVSVQIRAARWQLDGLHSPGLQNLDELPGKQRVAIVNKIARAAQKSFRWRR